MRRVTADWTYAICSRRGIPTAAAISLCISGIADAFRRARAHSVSNRLAATRTGTVPEKTGRTARTGCCSCRDGATGALGPVTWAAPWPVRSTPHAPKPPRRRTARNILFIAPTPDEARSGSSDSSKAIAHNPAVNESVAVTGQPLRQRDEPSFGCQSVCLRSRQIADRAHLNPKEFAC